MFDSDLFDRFQTVIAKTLLVDNPNLITRESYLKKFFRRGKDSFVAELDIRMALEEEFGIDLEEEFCDISVESDTAGRVFECVERKMNGG